MNGLICNQRDIPREVHRYGLRASADVGCGWVATYNALKLLGFTTDIDELIRYFEWQLPLIHGNLGTSFWAPERCFRKWGFSTKLVYQTKCFDAEAKAADVSIVFYHWAKKGGVGAHFVALRPTETGFVGYNTFRNSTGEDDWGESVEDFLRRQKYFGCVLLAIRQRSPQKEL
ncbi:MAG: hypothetical protein SOW84_08290 [Candidatus Faecousia sp.]|nr:hypothetical protein [Candidatus Faecousia sp.]